MAIQSPFFGKRDIETTGLRHAVPNAHPGAATRSTSTSAAYPASSVPAAAQDSAAAAASAPSGGSAAQATDAASGAREGGNGGSKLTVGPNIKLKGVEITDCDTLVVEGTVEATMDSRLMQIAECGAFKGSAEIDIAEIHGAFDGNLTVREKLVIHATGRVTGTVRYGRLVVEDGGQLSGDVQVGAGAVRTPARVAPIGKVELQPA